MGTAARWPSGLICPGLVSLPGPRNFDFRTFVVSFETHFLGTSFLLAFQDCFGCFGSLEIPWLLERGVWSRSRPPTPTPGLRLQGAHTWTPGNTGRACSRCLCCRPLAETFSMLESQRHIFSL